MIEPLVFLATLALSNSEPDFVETRLPITGDDFSYEFVDVNGDGRVDLVLTLYQEQQSVLELYLQQQSGAFLQRPSWRFSLPEDVTTYSTFELRDEPGLEFLLFNRGGVFSISPAREEIRGNLRRELRVPLFPDLPGSSAVPCWRLATDVNADGVAELFLPSKEYLLCFERKLSADGEPQLVEIDRIRCRAHAEEQDDQGEMRFGRGGFAAMGGRAARQFFPGANSSRPKFPNDSFISEDQEWSLPTLVDWNADGFLDALYRERAALMLSSFDPEEKKFGPPQSIGGESFTQEGDTRLRDLDGDGRFELLVVTEGSDDREKDHVARVFVRSSGSAFVEEPVARIKLSALDVTFRLADVNGDGFQDLLARSVKLPLGIATLADVRLDLAYDVFLGKAGGRLARRPSLTRRRSYRPEQLERIQEALIMDFSGDFGGDGLNDLVTLQPDGLLEITRLTGTGQDVRFEAAPWRSYRPADMVRDLTTWDLSSDGVSDLVLIHDNSLTIFVSVPAESPR